MLGRRFGNDAVTEMEDERQTRHGRANVVDALVESSAAARQQQWIEIADVIAATGVVAGETLKQALRARP